MFKAENYVLGIELHQHFAEALYEAYIALHGGMPSFCYNRQLALCTIVTEPNKIVTVALLG